MPIQSSALLTTDYTQDDIEAAPDAVRDATIEQAKSDLLTPSILRSLELNAANSPGTRGGGAYVKRLQPDEAKQYMAAAGLDGQFTFDREYTEPALKLMADRKRAELKRQSILARADQSGTAMAGRFGLTLATSFLDPLTVATAFVPVIGEAKYAQLLSKAGGALGRAGVRASVGAAEGAAGSILMEPIIYGAKWQEQADYTMTDSLLNIAVGTVLGGGLHTAGGVIRERITGEFAPKAKPAEQIDENGVIKSTGEPTSAPDALTAQQANTILPQTQMPEFKQWFGSSKMVDGEGKPLVMVHARNASNKFDEFSEDRPVFVASTEKAARLGAVASGELEYMPLYVRAEAPANTPESPVHFLHVSKTFKERPEVDSIYVDDEASQSGAVSLVVRSPKQLKSAASNSGKFDPNSGSLTDAGSIVANSTPDIREAALKSAVAQAVTGQPIEARPIFDRSTMKEAGARLNDPDQRPLSDPAAVQRADATIKAGETADGAAIERQVQELDEQLKAMEADAEMSGNTDMADIVATMRDELKQADAITRESTGHAKMLATCATRSAA